MITTLLALLGFLTLLRLSHQLYQFLTFHFVKPANPPLAAYKRSSPDNATTTTTTTTGKTENAAYALVTGSSAGIGLGIARELVLQGFGVVLLGHLPDELASAKSFLLSLSSSAKVETRVLDARHETESDLLALVNSLSHLPVSILVNNVGGNPIREPNFLQLGEHTCDDVDAVINQNTRFMARLTALMIPLLAKRDKQQEKSLIINMSSGGKIGMPYLVMYSATKGFNYSFSVALGRELKLNPETAHIDCMCVVPGEVKSQGNSTGVPDGAPTWQEFGRAIVWKTDGAVRRGWWEMAPNATHGVQIGLLNSGLLPGGVIDRELAKVGKAKRDAWWVVKGYSPEKGVNNEEGKKDK